MAAVAVATVVPHRVSRRRRGLAPALLAGVLAILAGVLGMHALSAGHHGAAASLFPAAVGSLEHGSDSRTQGSVAVEHAVAEERTVLSIAGRSAATTFTMPDCGQGCDVGGVALGLCLAVLTVLVLLLRLRHSHPEPTPWRPAWSNDANARRRPARDAPSLFVLCVLRT